MDIFNRKNFAPGRMVMALVTAALFVAAVAGCQKETSVETNAGNQTEQNANEGEENQQNQNSDQDDEGHGPDDDQELTEAGVLQGSWRSAFVEGDEPLAYFDIFHDEGASSASGDYTQAIAMGDMLDGTVGQIEEVTVDGDDVVVKWNPTNQDSEMYTLDLQRVDDDTFEGTFEAEQYPETHDATMQRRVVEDEEE